MNLIWSPRPDSTHTSYVLYLPWANHMVTGSHDIRSFNLSDKIIKLKKSATTALSDHQVCISHEAELIEVALYVIYLKWPQSSRWVGGGYIHHGALLVDGPEAGAFRAEPVVVCQL